jgi:hypothetical protein
LDHGFVGGRQPGIGSAAGNCKDHQQQIALGRSEFRHFKL